MVTQDSFLRRDLNRRVVITGAGWVTPLGADISTVWKRLIGAESGIRDISAFDAREFPVRIAGEVSPEDVETCSSATSSPSAARQTRFAVAAGESAFLSAGLSQTRIRPERLGVYLGCGETFPDLPWLADLIAKSVNCDGKFDANAFVKAALARIQDKEAIEQEPHAAASLLAARCRAEGPVANCIAGCVSSTQAIGAAADTIRRGATDVMLAGGAHSMINPLGMSGLLRLSVLTTDNELGSAAMRPFDADRDGFVAGEGGGIIVLEDYEHARRRGAEIWAELASCVSGHDAYRITDGHPQGRGLVGCVSRALVEADLTAHDIDYVSAHGTSTRLNDRTETIALKAALGERAYEAPISSVKSALGHFTTACGVIEIIVAALVLRHGAIPPTINLKRPDPECDLDYTPNQSRQKQCRHVLSTNLGFGGQVAAAVVSAYQG